MSETREAVIISAVRTPVGKLLGSLKEFKATDLGAIVVRESVKRAGVAPEDVDEVIMGCVLPAGLGQAPARQAMIYAGIPNTVTPSVPSSRRTLPDCRRTAKARARGTAVANRSSDAV